MQKQEYRTRINGYIRANRVKVISEDGSFIGEMETWQAIKLAQEQGLDLIEVNTKSIPPLCQVMEFGKWKYEAKKQQAEAKKKQKVQGLKELAIHANTEVNDLSRLVERAKEFLGDNNKVLFTCRLRGREMAHPEVAKQKMLWIIDNLKTFTAEHTIPVLEGKTISIMLTPSKASKTA